VNDWLMIKICATFEEWFLGDGTYPPLTQGQKVNLSFYINPTELRSTNRTDFEFKQDRYSDYTYCGRVLKTYQTRENSEISVVDCGQFTFCIEGKDKTLKEGEFVDGKGMLLLDYYMWAENVAQFEDAPNIFYNFRVDKIRRVKIPERFIVKDEISISHPTSLSPGKYSDHDMSEITDMAEDHNHTSFYLLDLNPIDEIIKKTFIYAPH
jgi:hypothetical protein